MRFPQRHQQQVVIAKTDHLGQRDGVMPRSFNADHFAHGRRRTLRLNDQTNQLCHASTRFSDPGGLNAMESRFDGVRRVPDPDGRLRDPID
jgi:hypothetical protein